MVAPSGKGRPADIGADSLRKRIPTRGSTSEHVQLDPDEYVLEVAESSAFVGALALQ